jgi:pimeloyl-ACP methyl ester carboxylesterase
VNLLSLGTAQRRLFAIHEAAAATDQRARAVVLCHPLGAEYTYAYRSMRHLAVRLAMSGCHTLRFDYYGTGDSAGDESQADLMGCESDVEAAIEALTDIAGTRAVTLIGLRFGANIAANVAARRAAGIEALVLWDPIVSGSVYPQTPQRDGVGNPLGEFTGRMIGDLQSLELGSLVGDLPQRTAMFVTDAAQSRDRLLQLGFGSGAKPVAIEFVASESPWLESATTTGMLPVPVIQRVIEWLR